MAGKTEGKWGARGGPLGPIGNRGCVVHGKGVVSCGWSVALVGRGKVGRATRDAGHLRALWPILKIRGSILSAMIGLGYSKVSSSGVTR